jgi:leucyl aminopeptidase (aminopeptidase T)
MAESNLSPEQLAGARWILQEALDATPGTSVLVMHDEKTKDVAACLEVAAQDSEVNLRKCCVPKKVQKRFKEGPDAILSDHIRDEIDKVTRVIFLQEWQRNTAAFRFAVLKYCASARGKRVASMPGVTVDHLDLCRGNLDELGQDCRLVADRLIWGRELTLKSRDRGGRERTLRAPITTYTPRTSTGRVPLQSWCNVPSGETFVVPNEWEVEGEVVITGSVPYYPVPEDEEVVLRVVAGRVQHPLECRGHGIQRLMRQLVFDAKGQEVCRNSAAVAEIGIGLNPSIARYTGLPIFDEKRAGTVHIALGSNNQFGGAIHSDMHNDMVIDRPSLFIDDAPVIQDRRLCLDRGAVFPNWKDVQRAYFDPGRPFARTGNEWREQRMLGKILAERSWYSDRSEGEIRTQIGDEETAAIATYVLWAIENQRLKTVSEVKRAVTDRTPEGAVEAVLELLTRFRLVSQE